MNRRLRRLARPVAAATTALVAATSFGVAPVAAAAADPEVNLTSPTRLDTVEAEREVAFTGTVTDDAGVARAGVAVRRLTDGRWLRADGSWGSFAWVDVALSRPGRAWTAFAGSFTPPATGEYVLGVQAWDGQGNVDPAVDWVKVTAERAVAPDTTAPVAEVTSPAAGGDVAVGTVRVAGTATDDRQVAKVEVAVKDARTGTWYCGDSQWGSFEWHTAGLDGDGRSATFSFDVPVPASGRYGLMVRATDAAGNLASAPWTAFDAASATTPTVPTSPDQPGGAVTPDPSVRYGVGTATLNLHDAARGRSLPTTVHYPAKPGTSGAGAPAATAGAYPVVIAGHGTMGSGPQAAQLHRFLTEAGYVLAAPTFPAGYDFPNLAKDISYALTGLLDASAAGRSGVPKGIADGERVGYIGTSMGAIAGLYQAERSSIDPRIDAVVAKMGTVYTGTFDWANAPALLMINGDADTVISYSSAVRTYGQARHPKALISLRGIGHDLAVRGSTLLHDAPLGFFAEQLLGDPAGRTRLVRSVEATSIASLQADW